MADFVFILVAIYVVIGVLFAIVFVTKGVATVDQIASGSSLAFRIIILPGCAALWPWLLIRWLDACRRSKG